MTISICQDAKREGSKRWSWWVWLEPEDELAGVERVEYKLHPTFPEPTQVRDNRNEKFELKASGWGEFMIVAELHMRDGTTELLNHWLSLEEGGSVKMAPEAGPARPKVFISSSVADATLAASLAESFDELGLFALTSEDLPVGAEVNSPAFAEAVGDLAGAVVLVSGHMSPWETEEILALRKSDVTIFPVVIGEKAELPKALEDLQQVKLEVRSKEAIEDATRSILSSLKMKKGVL
jgi:hypothetical protein